MYFEEFELDKTYALSSVTIEQKDMLNFAKKYDPLPIHTDEAYAKTTQFGGIIAPGVMSFMSVWAEFLQLHVLGNDLIAGKSTKIEWHAPVYAGDKLSGIAKITKLTPRNAYNGIVDVAVDIVNQDGVLVITSLTEAVVQQKKAK